MDFYSPSWGYFLCLSPHPNLYPQALLCLTVFLPFPLKFNTGYFPLAFLTPPAPTTPTSLTLVNRAGCAKTSQGLAYKEKGEGEEVRFLLSSSMAKQLASHFRRGRERPIRTHKQAGGGKGGRKPSQLPSSDVRGRGTPPPTQMNTKFKKRISLYAIYPDILGHKSPLLVGP